MSDQDPASNADAKPLTYELRTLIDDTRYGMACPDDLDAALDAIETALGMPITVFVDASTPPA